MDPPQDSHRLILKIPKKILLGFWQNPPLDSVRILLRILTVSSSGFGQNPGQVSDTALVRILIASSSGFRLHDYIFHWIPTESCSRFRQNLLRIPKESCPCLLGLMTNVRCEVVLLTISTFVWLWQVMHIVHYASRSLCVSYLCLTSVCLTSRTRGKHHNI